MKCKIPEISWHNRDPVLSVDIQPRSNNTCSRFYRLASGGTDSHVLIWYINFNEDKSELLLDVAADLTRHQRAVNVVKWSPNGELLASGDDESVILIWKQKTESEPLNILDNTGDQDKEIWITLKVLRGHMEDVYDLSWCPHSLYLVSGSVDNTAIVWDVYKGKSIAILNDHKGFVQGVVWDPKNQYIATLSTDRYLRIFDIQTKKVLYRVNKATLPVPEGNEFYGKRMRIYHDDTLQTFFRRLCFSPDGKFLLTPAGVSDYDGVTHPLHMSYIYSRYAFKQPAILLPCPDQYTVAIKFCPLLFKLRPHDATESPPVIPSPYRMIFAIATRCSVYLYDTQQRHPFGIISNIHYTRLTDISWSSDGCIIVVSSTDGFCSLITFERGELGDEYEDSAAILTKVINKENPIKEKKWKKIKENGSAVGKYQNDEEKIKIEPNTKSLEAVDERENEKDKTMNINDCSATTEIKQQSTIIADSDESTDKSEEMKNNVEKVDETATYTNSAHLENKKVNMDAEVLLIPRDGDSPQEKIKEKEILSSEEKFYSSDKNYQHATPIAVRRHPQVLGVTEESKVTSQTTIAALPPDKHSTQGKSDATITIRRTPRALKFPTSLMEKTQFLDEAMDASPLDDSEQLKQDERSETQIENKLDLAEDILLENKVASQESLFIKSAEEAVSVNLTKECVAVENLTPNPLTQPPSEDSDLSTKAVDTISPQSVPNPTRTPRRVALTTISTPKSKKKPNHSSQ